MHEKYFSRRKFLMTGSAVGAWTMLGGVAHAFQKLQQETKPENPWLSGNFAPVFDELNVSDLPVHGTLPASLNGTFLRNGPNPIYPPTPYHWFDGDGMIHAISIANGKASYSNRFVLTEGLLNERAGGKSLYGGLLAGPPFKNAANISVVNHHGKTLATWEGRSPHEIDPVTLATRGLYDFEKQWTGAFTAHPKIDPITGELICFGYDLRVPYVQYGVMNASGELSHATTINLPKPVMMHDFAITKKYTIFMDLPLSLSTQGLTYSPSDGARIGVLPRYEASSEIRWFNVDPCWVYHVLNAYEDDNEIVLIACRYSGGPDSDTFVLYEWRMNLKSGDVIETPLDSTLTEFPVVSPFVVGQKHRYGYAALDGSHASGIAKYDLSNRTKKTYKFGTGIWGGETCFVPNGVASDEDVGFLLNFVYNEQNDESAFTVLDAQSLTLLASVSLPRRVPFGLHGTWLPRRGEVE